MYTNTYRTQVFSPFGPGYVPEAHTIVPSFLAERRWSIFKALFRRGR